MMTPQDTDDALLWRELRDEAVRCGPRYDAATCGRCPLCQLGPTCMMFLSGIPWALCGHCNVRWPILSPPFDVPGDDPEVYAYYFTLLAEADAAPELRTPMKRHTPAPAERAPHIISDYDLNTRSIAKFELFQFAETLAWPSIFLASHGVTIPAGQLNWFAAPLGMAGTRRQAWMELVALTHHTAAKGEQQR